MTNEKAEEKDTIYLVPHMHYDAIWAFTKEDYFHINMMFILKNVVELLEKVDYRFLIEQTFLLEEMEPLLWRHKFLACTKKIIVYRDIPRIDFITYIEDKHPRSRLRVRFSTNVKSSAYACGSQFCVVSRPTDQYNYKPEEEWVEDPCGVFPSLMWLDYSDGKKGMTVMHKREFRGMR